MEELVAEIGAAFLCADLGITLETRDDHAAYIASWLQVLKDDKRAIFTAASHAQKAAAGAAEASQLALFATLHADRPPSARHPGATWNRACSEIRPLKQGRAAHERRQDAGGAVHNSNAGLMYELSSRVFRNEEASR
jgi:hypothetical protein